MLYISDSTGNEDTEHVFLEFAALAAKFPAVTLLYRLVDPGTGVYGTATTIQTGTGTCTIYNCALSGHGQPRPQPSGPHERKRQDG